MISRLPRPEYFDTLRECLMEALAEALGDRFTGEVESAWGAAFDAIASVVLSNYPVASDSGPGALSVALGSDVVGF